MVCHVCVVHTSETHRLNTGTDLQTVLEAVGWGFVTAVSVLLPPFAEQKSSLIKEEVSLHGFESSQLLHTCGAFLMADPHTEGALHQHMAQLTEVSLQRITHSVKVHLFTTLQTHAANSPHIL